MVKRSDKKPSSENYSFIKETIKEHPTDKKKPCKEISDSGCMWCDFWRLCGWNCSIISAGSD